MGPPSMFSGVVLGELSRFVVICSNERDFIDDKQHYVVPGILQLPKGGAFEFVPPGSVGKDLEARAGRARPKANVERGNTSISSEFHFGWYVLLLEQ